MLTEEVALECGLPSQILSNSYLWDQFHQWPLTKPFVEKDNFEGLREMTLHLQCCSF
jgi:hypothetical protein